MFVNVPASCQSPCMKPPPAAQASNLLVQLVVPSAPESLCIQKTPLLVQGPPPLAHQPSLRGPPAHCTSSLCSRLLCLAHRTPHTSRTAPGTNCILGKTQPCPAESAPRGAGGGVYALQARKVGECRLQAWGPFPAMPRVMFFFVCSFFLPIFLLLLCGENIDKPFEYLFTEKIHRSQGVTFNSNI